MKGMEARWKMHSNLTASCSCRKTYLSHSQWRIPLNRMKSVKALAGVLFCLFLSFVRGQESYSWTCAINGAAYGNIYDGSPVREWAPLVGKACADSGANRCFSDAIEWSSVALEHGNRPVNTADECAGLCAQVQECQVWTFWPRGTPDSPDGKLPPEPKCDVCPVSLGGSFDPQQGFCTEGDCSDCGSTYDYIAAQGIPADAGYSCEDTALWFASSIGCCFYDEQAKAAYQIPATCELYRAPPNRTNVLAYGLEAITGPKDCSNTRWLPFLEPVQVDNDVVVQQDLLEPVIVNHTLNGYCDMCPEDYGFQLLATNEICYDDGTCDTCQATYDSVKGGNIENGDCGSTTEWFITVAGCCVVPENPVAPPLDNQETETAADPLLPPLASDGRLCWVDNSSYGSAKDGACAEADIVEIHSHPETIELGRTQGWWSNPVTGVAIEPIPYNDGETYTVSDCHQACIDNAKCGGWQFQGGSCILKTALDCSPTIARTTLLNTIAGVSGCVDTSSNDPAESSALDTSNLWFLDCSRPRCTQPYSYNGRWTGDTYVPDMKDQDACWYKQYTTDELFDGCAQNRWIVINGGSNSLSFFIQMVNLFAPIQRAGDLEPLIDFGYDDGANLYSMIDIVFRRGSLPILNRTSDGIIHFNKKRFCDVDASLPCMERSLDLPEGQVDWPLAYGAALERFIAEAPYEAGATRLTLVVGQFWGATTETLKAVTSVPQNSGWATNKILFYGQAMVWYACNIDGWCEVPALGSSDEEMLFKYRSDLEGLLDVGKDVCDSDRVDCFFATAGFGKTISKRVQAMVDGLEEMTAPYDWANFIDYNGFLADEEIVGGHLMPSMFLPVFAMLWNTVCDGPSVGCPQAISSSPICWTDCLERREDSSEVCSSCVNSWECANEEQCDTQVLDPVPWHIATSIVSYARNEEEETDTCFLAGEGAQRRVEEESGLDGEKVTDSCKNRVWCGTIAQGRLVGALVFVAGIAVIAFAHFRSARTKKKLGREKAGGEKDVAMPLAADVPAQSLASFQSESSSTMSRSEGGTDRTESPRFDGDDESIRKFSFVASVRGDGSVTVQVLPGDEAPGSKADKGTAAPSEAHNCVQSGPVCVDDFDDDSISVSYGEGSVKSDFSTNADLVQSMPVCVDDFIDTDSMSAEDRLCPVVSMTSAGDGHSMSLVSNLDIENPASASSPSHKPKPPALLSKDYLHSLGIARLLASVHIVLGHLYAKGAIANVYFFGWGFTWVPWFFMLSGYVLTHARLNSRDPTKFDGPYTHIAKRLSTIFPMYALGVFLSMLIQILRSIELPGYDVLIGQSFLMQSWVPLWTEEALLSHCWFLSNMVVYWAGFGFVYKWVRKLSLGWTCAILAFISFLPWLLVIIPAISDQIEADWYSDHSWGSTESSNDIWTIMLKFNPIFYVHVFLFGMLLSVLRDRVKNAGSNTDSALTTVLFYIIRFGATFGYLGLILVFTVVQLQPAGYKLSARLTVLLPLQGLILLGLSPLPQLVANNSLIDPLAYLFSLGPPWIGDVSYCQYILQFIMYSLFPVSQITNASFFLYLLGASMLSYKFVQEPAANAWRRFLPKNDDGGAVRFLPSLASGRIIFIPPLVLATILVIAKAAYSPSFNGLHSSSVGTGQNNTSANSTSVVDVVRVATEAVDLKLNWTVASSTEEDGSRLLINPSMIFLYDGNGNLEWIRAARAHSIEENTQKVLYEGQEVTEQFLNFKSSVALSRETFVGNLAAGFDEGGIKSWGLDGIQPLSIVDSRLISNVGKGSAWNNLCESKPSFDRENSWLVRKQVSGPEDPKLIQLSSGTDSSWGVTFSSFPPASLLSEGSSQEECKWADEAVMQMYLAEDGPSLASGATAHGSKLQCGNPEGMEKNWIAFLHDDALYYVYSIVPHVIVQVRSADGACVNQYETTSRDLKKLSKTVSAIRGSATAVRYSETEYLALLHTTEPSVGYSTHLYTFEAQPPFAVKRVSKKLSLQGGGRAFPSSLSLIHDKVLIGYGDDDKFARVLVMSLTALEDTFDWCSDSV